jgi:Uma2 family endonuclease
MNRITIPEFEAFADAPENRERRFELIDGQIVEKGTTEERGIIAGNIAALLGAHLRPEKLGRLTHRVYHRIPADNYNGLLPDIAYTRRERALPIVRVGSVPQMPDLVVEVKSADDLIIMMHRKAAYYIENGTQMVWLVFPEKRVIEVYYANGDLQILTEADELSGGEVLPGFTLAVSELFKNDF